MMTQLKNILVIGFLAILLQGCIAQWTMVKNTGEVGSTSAFKVSMPEGWMRSSGNQNLYMTRVNERNKFLRVDRISLTRDGLNLQRMDFIRFRANEAFPHIEKEYKASMLPAEAAELLIADIKAEGLQSFKVHSNKPVAIDGQQGFRLHISYKNEEGLAFEYLVFAFGDKSGFYKLSFAAPSLHYFPTYQSEFDKAVKSFQRVSMK